MPLSKSLILCAMLLYSFFNNAQALASDVSINVSGQPLSKVLFSLSEQAHFDFSYDSRLLSTQKNITINVTHKPLAQVLGEICAQTGLQYKEAGNQIIFFAALKKEPPVVKHHITGQVTDYSTGQLLQGVNVKEEYFRLATNTDNTGSYQLTVPNPDYTVHLTYNLQGYERKSYLVKLDNNQTLNVSLKSKVETAPAQADTFQTIEPISFPVALARQLLEQKDDSAEMTRMAVPIIQQPVMGSLLSPRALKNLHEDSNLMVVPFKLSVFPGISSSGFNDGNTMVKGFSLNIFAGLNAGVDGFEAGSLVNINRFNVKGMQAAGIGNISGGQLSGFQAAGVVNINRLKVTGFQGAGVHNLAGSELKGFQGAGVANVVRGTMDGMQAAGVFNLATQGGSGFQAAGVANTSGQSFKGFQAAGLINATRGVHKGVQASGLINAANEIKGAQIGVFNYAGKVKGVQIGVFNFADTITSGVPIGFFSFVKNGYRSFEVHGMETSLINLRFHSGTHQFYNIFSIGARPASGDFLWDYGYGIGTILRAEKRVFFNFEGSSYQLNAENGLDKVNILNRAEINIGFKIYKKLAVMVGPSLNIYVVDKEVEAKTPLQKPHVFYTHRTSNTLVEAWLGLNCAVKF